MSSQIIDIFKPDRNKITLAVILPFFVLLIFYIVIIILSVFQIGISKTVTKLGDFILGGIIPLSELNLLMVINLIIVFLFISIAVYPVTCSLLAVYKIYKRGDIRDINKTTLLLIVLCLTIFNPFLWFAKNTMEIGNHPTSAVQITKIESDSPFNIIHYYEGRIVYEIRIVSPDSMGLDEHVYPIRNSTDFFSALNEAHIDDSIYIDTFDGYTSISIKENITDWGIDVRDVELG